MSLRSLLKRKRVVLVVVAAAVLVIAASAVGFQGVRAWWAWRGIERVAWNIADARGRLSGGGGEGPFIDDSEYETVLVIANDFSARWAERQEGVFADAVLYWIVPTDGGDPALVSLPRDLLVPNPCGEGEAKLDRTITGCGDAASGAEAVAIAVEDYTGIKVDHFAMLGMDPFIDAIDALGCIEICTEHAVRDIRGQQHQEDLLPAGCSLVDGTTALRWVRSRRTQEFVDGEWRYVKGDSDLNRAEKQQTLLFTMLTRLKAMRSPTALVDVVGSISDAVVLDDGLSMADAISMVWDLRDLPLSSIRRIVIPVEPTTTQDGAYAVRGTVPLLELLGRNSV